jgi:aminoglycoside phosphotransferase (APT) family kinase protein
MLKRLPAPAAPHIDLSLVQRLVRAQLPQWADLPIKPVAVGGWYNRTFHLGEQLLVRLPSSVKYADNVRKEQTWLPWLAPKLPLPIPEPLAMGSPGEGYPWNWSVYRWIEGETVTSSAIADMDAFAHDLAQFLLQFQSLDTTGGPLPGKHNFFRGGSLVAYDHETRQALEILKEKIDTKYATELWEEALETSWTSPPVWVHGDISSGNLLVRNGKLSAVIDFGCLAIGDPACDLMIAWTFFQGKSRKAFRQALPYNTDTWVRAQAWVLWKALIVMAGLCGAPSGEAARWEKTLQEILAE